MTHGEVIELGREALWIVALISSPLLIAALAVGLIIGVIQAATSINEMTLSFIPKLVALVIAIYLFGSWQLMLLTDFSVRQFEKIPGFLGL
jgi:flagellar biosynthetic protein FliQ